MRKSFNCLFWTVWTFSIVVIILSFEVNATQINIQKGLNQSIINETLNKIEIPLYIKRIDFYRRDFDGLCGWYNFGGTIKINLQENCDSDFTEVINHELRHAYFFQVWNYKQRNIYCQSIGLKNGNNRQCWEEYAYKN